MDHWFGRGSFHHRRRLTGTWNVNHSAWNMGTRSPQFKCCDGIYAPYTAQSLDCTTIRSSLSREKIRIRSVSICRVLRLFHFHWPNSVDDTFLSRIPIQPRKKFKRQNSNPDPAAWVVVDQTAPWVKEHGVRSIVTEESTE